jgi:hypothetical protein
MTDPVDVAIDETTVYVADSKLTATGAIYIVEADSTLTPLTTSEPISSPAGITIDPISGDLLVLDQGPGRVVSVDPATGQVDDIATGLPTAYAMWAGIDATPDGRRMFITSYGDNAIYVLARCDATGDPAADCDDNGVYDYCDVAVGGVPDCNHNGVPDDCDLASGASADCNGDGVLDDCPVCPPVQVVFVMDTSTSMDDEAAVLCGAMGLIVDYLEVAGVTVLPTLFGICDTPGGAYGCLEAAVTDSLGTVVPGSPPSAIATLGDCPGGLEVCQEDWGRATAVVAGLFPWLPAGESIRLIIPLSDEGPWCGDPVSGYDQSSITHAISVAVANGVIVSPITGSGSSGSVIALAQALADSTGGTQFSSSTSATAIAYAIADRVLEACASFGDCDLNGALDECEIAGHPNWDRNGDDILDVCQPGTVGVPPDGPPAAGDRLDQNHPNPFNPRTVVSFHIAEEGDATVAVYAVDGRRVRSLVAGWFGAGQHEVVWNGRDDQGRDVPSGVYFYRLTTARASETRRMVLIR